MQDSQDNSKKCQCPYPDCGLISDFSPLAPNDDSPPAAHLCPACQRQFSPRSLAAVQMLRAAQERHLRHIRLSQGGRSAMAESTASVEDLSSAVENSGALSPLSAHAKSSTSTGSSANILDPAVHKLIVIADNIRSLHNVGAIFRTADAAGFSFLYLCGLTGVPPRNEISKVSLGSETWLPYKYEMFLPAAVDPLKKLGYQIVALEKCPGSVGLYESLKEGNLQLPLALIVGNEVGGLSHEGVAMADRVCHLNMRGKKESLNVSVAFGVASYFLAEYLL